MKIEYLSKCKTPSYIFDIDKLIKRVNYIKEVFKDCNIIYAIKANSFVVKEINSYVDGFEICSFGEFNICNNLNIKHSKMVISGVNKDYESIDYLIKNFDILKYTIESINQYKLLTDLSKKYHKTIHVLVRLTSDNQFGVTVSEFKSIIKDNNEFLIIDGIEYFSGTQKHSIKKISKEIDFLNDVINEVEEELNFKINEVEYGPGLPIFYFQDEEFDEDEFFKNVNDLLKKFKNKKVSLEIGRSLVAECGYYITKVVDLKSNKYGNNVILDGGINHLVYYGQTMAMRIPHFEVITKNSTKLDKIYNLYGSLCTINDIIVKNISIKELVLGDIFIFKNVGAYSVTEGISLFLSRDLPYVYLYKNDKLICVRKNILTSDINTPKYEE